MAITNLGAVGISAGGAYNPETVYKKYKVVSANGGSYMYINPTPAAGVPVTNTSHWQQIATMGGQELVDAAVAARDAAIVAKALAEGYAAQLAAGTASPAGTYANLAALTSANPDHSKIYITLDDGKWCYYDTGTSAFVAGGVYQSILYPAFDSFKEQFLVPDDIVSEFVFEKYGLNENGTENTVSTRIRTDGYYMVGGKNIVVSVSNGTVANFCVRMYDSNFEFQNIVSTEWQTEPMTIPQNYYFRIGMRYANDAAIPSIAALSQHINITEYVFGLSSEDIGEMDGSLNGSVLLDESVTPSKTSFLKTTVKTVSQVPGIGFNSSITPTETRFAAGILSFSVVVEPYERVTFTLGNCDRYVLGIFDGIPTLVEAYMHLDEGYSFAGFNTYTYQNSDGIRKYALVYGKSVSGSESATVTAVSHNYIDMNDHYFASGAIDGEALDEESVPPSKLSFIRLLDKKLTIYNGYGGNKATASTTIYVGGVNTRSYVTIIEPNETVEIIPTNNDRFQVGLFDDFSVTLQAGAVFDEMYDAMGLDSYTYTNTDSFQKLMYIYVKSSSNVSVVTCTVHSMSGFEFTGGYYLKSDSGEVDRQVFEIGENTTEIYPVMTAVKMSNQWDFTTTHPSHARPIGWLYYDPTTYKFYYSMGKPDNLKYLFTWAASIAEGTTPNQYRAFITKNNDIIFIWRGDILYSITPRRNPIVYPSGAYDTPVLIDFGEGLKPTAWAFSMGADYLYNQNVFMFAEYTRPAHVPNANIWRVTEPVTDVLNWSVVHSIALSGDWNTGIKHYHIINYDPYSGMCYASSGDDDTAAKIYASSDYGLNWTTILEGNRQYARLCNLCFTQEKVYWANDDNLHGIYSIDRGIGNVPDFTNITTLSSLVGHPPTYANILIDDPYGILILNRHDTFNNGILDVLFWSIDDGALYTLATLAPANKTLTDGDYSSYGFRYEAVNFYHSRGDNRIVMGFNNPLNGLDIMSNDIADGLNSAINTITMKVYKTATGYGIEFGAIMMSE